MRKCDGDHQMEEENEEGQQQEQLPDQEMQEKDDVGKVSREYVNRFLEKEISREEAEIEAREGKKILEQLKQLAHSVESRVSVTNVFYSCLAYEMAVNQAEPVEERLALAVQDGLLIPVDQDVMVKFVGLCFLRGGLEKRS